MTVLMQQKVESMGVVCEDMCKEMGAYPNCQCPGFAGQPASSDDERACYVKYCQNEHCPTEQFTTCVKELTKVSALQWGSVLSRAGRTMQSMLQIVRGKK